MRVVTLMARPVDQKRETPDIALAKGVAVLAALALLVIAASLAHQFVIRQHFAGSIAAKPSASAPARPVPAFRFHPTRSERLQFSRVPQFP